MWNKVILFIIALGVFFCPKTSFAGDQYHISANDVLEISVYGEPDLTRIVRVSMEGTITYPFIGEVIVEGLPIQVVQRRIRDLLEKDYLVNPQVSVYVKEYNKVYVLGQVEKPGEYDLKGTLTAVEAISLAGGFTKYAAPNRTKIIRKANGNKIHIRVPVSKILSKKKKWKDIELLPGDVVLVPESLL